MKNLSRKEQFFLLGTYNKGSFTHNDLLYVLLNTTNRIK